VFSASVAGKITGTDTTRWNSASSGDITAVVAGSGLDGGAVSGVATVALNAASIASLALADTALQPVSTQGLVTASVTNGLASISYVDGATNGIWPVLSGLQSTSTTVVAWQKSASNECIRRDGSIAMTGTFDMGGKDIVGLASVTGNKSTLPILGETIIFNSSVGTVRPATNGNTSFGTNDYRWLTLWGYTANAITGTFTTVTASGTNIGNTVAAQGLAIGTLQTSNALAFTWITAVSNLTGGGSTTDTTARASASNALVTAVYASNTVGTLQSSNDIAFSWIANNSNNIISATNSVGFTNAVRAAQTSGSGSLDAAGTNYFRNSVNLTNLVASGIVTNGGTYSALTVSNLTAAGNVNVGGITNTSFRLSVGTNGSSNAAEGIMFGNDVNATVYRYSTSTVGIPYLRAVYNMVCPLYYGETSSDFVSQLLLNGDRQFLWNGQTAGGTALNWMALTNNAGTITLRTGKNSATTNAFLIGAGTNMLTLGQGGPVSIIGTASVANVLTVSGTNLGETVAAQGVVQGTLQTSNDTAFAWISNNSNNIITATNSVGFTNAVRAAQNSGSGSLDEAGTNYFRNAGNLTNIQKWASVTNADYATTANVASNLTSAGSNAFYLVGVKVVSATNADVASVISGVQSGALYGVQSTQATVVAWQNSVSNRLTLMVTNGMVQTNASFVGTRPQVNGTNVLLEGEGTTLDATARTAASNAQATANYASNAVASAPIRITDARFFLAGLNQAAQSVRAKFSISQKADNRCTDLVFLYTNQLYYSVTSTVAGAADAYTNVVGDASGFIVNDMYTKPDASQLTWQTCSNAAGTVVSWNCSNMVTTAVGTTISRVNRLRVPDYYDATGSSNIYCNLQFLTGYTNTVGISLTYWSRTNFFTYTNNIVVSNSAAFSIPYVK
jgi:hypothetical protein